MEIQKIKVFFKNNIIIFLIITIVILIFFSVYTIKLYNENKDIKLDNSNKDYDIVVDKHPSNEMLFLNSIEEKYLPKQLRYININESALKNILESRNSILADEPYFSTIISVAKEMDINPLLIFAISGQEQGFVSKDNKSALQIANNPFNVFGSWKKYNTDIRDSCEITARTLINLSKNRPYNEDPIKWINLRGGRGGYAEDENWWIGVTRIFEKLRTETYQ